MSQGKQRSLLETAQERLSAVSNTISGQPHFTFPPFDKLPAVPGQPQGCAWGLFDKNGIIDEIGTLNLLTPEVVQLASKEIKSGTHVQLDCNLSDKLFHFSFGRKALSQKVIDARRATKGKVIGFDDEVSFNTQASSQWDSLKHYAHQESQMYYNGLSHDQALTSDTNGIHKWCERGGIVGRGVLVDWLRWYEAKHGDPPSPVSRHEIPVSELEEVLRWQGTTTKVGDILLVRTGYTRWHTYAPPVEKKGGAQQNSGEENTLAIGVENNETSVRWLYDRHFAAVAGDTLAFEAWPPPATGWSLHPWLLVQWGTPIGELWNLEELSKMCEKEARWTFFLTSAPLHVRGGVGSPPGAIAIF